MAAHPGGRYLLTGSRDQRVRIWDLKTGCSIQELTEHEHRLMGCAFSADGAMAATASRDGTLRLWDARGLSGRSDPSAGEPRLVELGVINDGMVGLRSVTFSADGEQLAACGDDGVIRSWSLRQAGTHLKHQERFAKAKRVLESHPDNQGALREVDEWYAFRGVPAAAAWPQATLAPTEPASPAEMETPSSQAPVAVDTHAKAREFWFWFEVQPPGVRHWVETGPQTWEERYENGERVKFNVVGEFRNGEYQGTLLRRFDGQVEVLIPPIAEGVSLYCGSSVKNTWRRLPAIHLGTPPERAPVTKVTGSARTR